MKSTKMSISLSMIFFIIGILTLSDYGINWDASYRMIRGQNFLSVYLNENPQSKTLSPMFIKPYQFATRFDFLDGEEGGMVKFKEDRPLFKKDARQNNFYNDPDFTNYFLTSSGHPPLIDELAALSNRFLWGWLGIVGEVSSYQLIYLLFSAVGVFIVGAFAFEITSSKLASAVASLSLALFPLFFAESHFNMKDSLQSAMFAGSIWSFWHWVRGDKIAWRVVFIIFVIIALAIKWNIIFLPFIILPWLFLIRKTKEFKKWFNLKRLLVFAALTIVVGILFLTITDPSSWQNPYLYFINLINFYLKLGIQPNPLQPPGFILGGFNLYPTLLFLTQTPEIILVLGVIGLIRLFKQNGEQKLAYLFLLWVTIPIIRVSLPHAFFYNGFRQIMEVIPAVAILAGLGTNFLVQNSKLKIKNLEIKILNYKLQLLTLFFTLLIFLVLLMPILQLHPNQNLYFNNLAGGFQGAVKKNLVDKKITYGNVYKQAANWLNKNVEKDASIAFLDGPMFALSPLFLRNDISTSPFHFNGFDQKGEYILTLFDPMDEAFFAKVYPQKFLNPVHQIMVDGIPILSIYQNSPQFVKKEYQKNQIEETSFQITPKFMSGKRFLQVDLGKKVKVTKINLINKLPTCQKSFSQYIDEYIEFETGKKYGLQERNATKDGVELFFPAEYTSQIKIQILDQYSCFLSGKISSITYFSD